MGSSKEPDGPRTRLAQPRASDTVPGPATESLPGASTAKDEDYSLVQGFGLEVVEGVDRGTSARCGADRFVVGTHDSCDLVLADPAVSRFHVEIVADPEDGLVLRDLNSRNGTVVSGVPVLQARLFHGATIAIGRTQLRLDVGSDSVKLELSKRRQFGLMIGQSTAMRRVFSVLERAAASQATVLLAGETGTGKEVAAESIHLESTRRDGPLVVVDCGALPASLLETELFGHVKGAFTGAVSDRPGAFEAASGGTVFLDEIGELSPELQPKLLRVLEKRETKRVGSNDHVPVDVRVVAATNRNLRVEVNQKRFRSDLYYRLAVIQVTLPPLRERLDDLPLLVEHIASQLAHSGGDAPDLRAPAFLAELARHSWPGNVRELRNYIESYVALQAQPPLLEPAQPDGEMPVVDLSLPLKQAREDWLRPFEREYAAGLLRRFDNNVSAAARAAGVERITFYRLLSRHGLR